jgi:hypothetical protein
MLKLKYVFGSLSLAMFLFACVPATKSPELATQTPIYWQTTLPDFEWFVVWFVRNFDEKFANTYVVSNLESIHEIKLGDKAYLDTDGKLYQLMVLVSQKTSTTSSFVLINEQDDDLTELDFPVGTMAFRLNTELTKALDGRFKRLAN